MCGIVGITGPDGGRYISAMSDLLVHRGPDDSGIYQDPTGKVSLAMRRLSIIDLESGHQPMGNEDGTNWIVFNGEIYNAPELRRGLEEQGHRFITKNSDTEVLLHLYAEKGREMVHDLNGMFAFVIYDKPRGILFGARDRIGIKPLYYWQGVGRFVFASELKVLSSLPFVEREVDLQSLFHYMTLLYVPDQDSILKGIKRVPPAHVMIYDLESSNITLERYWHLSFKEEQHTQDEWADILRVELKKAIERWIVSDVPIACSLSGGLDSSAIVGLLAELGYPKVKTYTLGFTGKETDRWNETELARVVAERWGTEHHEILLQPGELLDDLVSMVWHLDEPYGGGLPSWYVFRQISRDVKVALTGTGGDELFGNYGKFANYETKWPAMAGAALRKLWRGSSRGRAKLLEPLLMLSDRVPARGRWLGRGGEISRFLRGLDHPFGTYYYANLLYMSDDTKRDCVFQSGPFQGTEPYFQQIYDGLDVSNVRDGIASVDFQTQLPEEFLLMTDRFSMAHGLEARVPLLDHWLVEKVFSIPASIRTRSGNLKYLFKKAVGDLIPRELVSSTKRGFVLPIELWLRTDLRPLAERLLNPERLKKQGIFKPEFFEKVAKPHLEGSSTNGSEVWSVWGAIMFQLWHLIYIERLEKEVPTYSWKDIC